MQLRGYNDRVDFVARSGAAGAICFGDPRSLVEEFFGSAHRETTETGASTGLVTTLYYYNDALEIVLGDAGVESITMHPGKMKEKVQLFKGAEKIDNGDKDDKDSEDSVTFLPA